MTSPFDGFRTPPGFMWKWPFCEEWQILGGIVESQEQLAKWATLLFQSHEHEDPRAVAREEFASAQSADKD